MTATLDIPDELYQEVVSRTAARGQRLRDVTVELYQRWLRDATVRPEESGAALDTGNVLPLVGNTDEATAGSQWLHDWVAMGTAVCKDVPDGPTARELLQQDRNRLEAQGLKHVDD